MLQYADAGSAIATLPPLLLLGLNSRLARHGVPSLQIADTSALVFLELS